jgi:pimeloyl-ACP methyl ester carboxylesterase
MPVAARALRLGRNRNRGGDMVTTPAVVKDYIDVNGVHTYYEVRGAGEPVLLLHGGMTPIETWEAQTQALAEQYQVYLPERRGHGRTADVAGPITYGLMAEDTAAFMDALGITNARVAGWSDGGNVALILAMKRPDLVRKVILLGCAANIEGYGDKFDNLKELTLDALPPMATDAYKALSPDGPQHLPILWEKIARLWTTEPAHDLSELSAIGCPTLVMQGDDDVATFEHIAAMARAIPDSQVAIVPGTDHMVMFEKPELVNRIFLDFFADEQAPKLFAH